MPNHSAADLSAREAKQAAASRAVDLMLRPMPVVEAICDSIGHTFCPTAYRPVNVLWMFIQQVLCHANDFNTAVTRLHSRRVA